MKKLQYKNNEFVIEHRENEGIVKLIEKDDTYSKHLINLIESYNPKVVLDIGANIGLTALQFSTFADVHAFEACDTNAHFLLVNVMNNFLKHKIVISSKAVGHKSGEANLRFCGADTTENDSGHSFITDLSTFSKFFGGKGIEQETMKTEMITIDDYIEKEKIEKVDAIKLDIEGFEYYALQGMQKLLKRDKPILVIEQEKGHIKCRNQTTKEILAFIRWFGYEIKLIVYNGTYEPDLYNVGYDLEKEFGLYGRCLDILCY